MENKDVAEMEWREKFFYDFGADGSFIFKNEEPIQVSKTILAYHSKFFDNLFFGPTPRNQVHIEHFNRASFKIFLDCLLGLKEYSLLDTLIVYPIAQEYEEKESLKKWIEALKPKVMDENVSLVLNFSVFYENEELTDYVINFIKKNYGVVNFLENKKYSNNLDVLAMCKLIDSVDLNSLIWSLVYEWGENFLKIGSKSDIKTFFVENGILEKISFSHFESAKALVDFHELSKKQLLGSDEILTYLHTKPLNPRKMLPDDSHWVKIPPGFSFKERIILRKIVDAHNVLIGKELEVVIWPNKIIFEPEATGLKIKARYLFRHSYLRANPDPIWDDSVNLFDRANALNSWAPGNYDPFGTQLSEEFELNLIDDSDVPVYKFVTIPLQGSLEVHWIEISYKFSSPCWILKTALDKSKYPVYNNDLYFTKNVCILKENEKDEDMPLRALPKYRTLQSYILGHT